MGKNEERMSGPDGIEQNDIIVRLPHPKLQKSQNKQSGKDTTQRGGE